MAKPGQGPRGAGGSDEGDSAEVGEEFKDIDTDVTDDEITEAAEKFIDAMWTRAEEKWTLSQESGKDRADPYAEENWAKIEAGLEEAQAAIRKRYEDLLTPRPSAFDPLIASTENVAMALGSADISDFEPGDEPTRLGGSDDFDVNTLGVSYLTQWRGDLKYTLTENYLKPFPGILATQGSLAKTLGNTARLLKLIFERRRSDAKKLADQATTAVEVAGPSGGGEGLVFLLLGIFGAAIPVAGTMTSAVIGAAASSASAIGGSFAADEEELPLSAGTVQGVVDNLFAALDESDKTMRTDEDAVIKLLQSIEMLVSPLADYADDTKANGLIPMTPYVSYDTDITEELKPLG